MGEETLEQPSLLPTLRPVDREELGAPSSPSPLLHQLTPQMFCLRNQSESNSTDLHSCPLLVTGVSHVKALPFHSRGTRTTWSTWPRLRLLICKLSLGRATSPNWFLNSKHDASGTDWELEAQAFFPLSSNPLHVSACALILPREVPVVLLTRKSVKGKPVNTTCPAPSR